MSISLVVGLGNPGQEYQDTRHNLGFILVEAMALSLAASPWALNKPLGAQLSKTIIGQTVLWLAKPSAYMNLSGGVVNKVALGFKIPMDEVVIVHDDINIPLGQAKLSIGGSSGGHNGVEDILKHCENSFLRFRIGIGLKNHPEMDLKDHVLGKFTAEEKSALTTRLPHLINDLMLLIQKGATEAMNSINQKNKSS